MVQDIWDICIEEMGVVLPGLMVLERPFRPIVWMISGVLEALVLKLGFCRLIAEREGPVTGGLQAFRGRGAVQIWKRRLGGRTVRGSAAS